MVPHNMAWNIAVVAAVVALRLGAAEEAVVAGAVEVAVEVGRSYYIVYLRARLERGDVSRRATSVAEGRADAAERSPCHLGSVASRRPAGKTEKCLARPLPMRRLPRASPHYCAAD